MLIGLTGYKGVGKSVVARHLVESHRYVRRPFAYHLKAMMSALGVPPDVLDGDDAAKSAPLDVLCGATARHAMQTLGTEWGRKHLGEDFWVKRWMSGVKDYAFVVVDDVRFPNEVDAVRSLGGKVIRVCRESCELGDGHASENPGVLGADFQVWNDGTPEDLCRTIDDLLFPDAREFEKYADEDAEMTGARAL